MSVCHLRHSDGRSLALEGLVSARCCGMVGSFPCHLWYGNWRWYVSSSPVDIALNMADITPDYPMTSTLAAEHKIIGSRAKLILLVFAFLALGTLTAAVVFVVLLAAFRSAIETNIARLEWVWRLLLGLGIIPAAFTLYARLRMKETVPYKKCK